MDQPVTIALTALLAYLVGAIPFGYLVGRWRGVDIFQHGSGNIGATNVGRILGWRCGLLVFLLDFAKGAAPAAAGLALGRSLDFEPPVALGVIAGLAALVGHIFPIYLRFRGGKGVATGAGVVAVLLPLPTAAALATWLVIVIASRYVSLASLAAAAVLCTTHIAMSPEPFGEDQRILTWFSLAATALVIVKHRANIARLIRGNENHLPETGTMQLAAKTLHVLAVGLWFGMVVFFSFPVALSLFDAFEKLAESTDRPTWFPLPTEYKLEPDLQKTQGTRAAGFAVSPIFHHYFLWQGICGLIATVTALGWSRSEPGRRVHGVRSLVLLLGLTTVVLGWPIERTVSDWRQARSEASDRVMDKLKANDTPAVADAKTRYEAARKEFATWHLWSLLLNFVTILLVTIGMGLTAQLPSGAPSLPRPPQEKTLDIV